MPAARRRALLATGTGEVFGVRRADGASTWSSGASVVAAVDAAVSSALGSVDPGSVAGGVIAIAGGGARSAEFAAGLTDTWRARQLPGSPAIVIDVVAAYAAGSVARRGLVLAAGTGAIAAIVSDGGVVRRTGGHGWRVGDEGSAVTGS